MLGLAVARPLGAGREAKQWATNADLKRLRNRGLVDARDRLLRRAEGLDCPTRSVPPGRRRRCRSCALVHMVRKAACATASKTALGPDHRPVCEGENQISRPTVEAAEARFAEFAGEWRELYTCDDEKRMGKRLSGEEFGCRFYAFPAELRKIVYTANAVESLNARFRRAVRHRSPTSPPSKQHSRCCISWQHNGARTGKTMTGTIFRLETDPQHPARPLRRPDHRLTETNDNDYLHKESDKSRNGPALVPSSSETSTCSPR